MPKPEPGAGLFIKVDVCNLASRGEPITGDVFLSRKLDPGGRIVAVLADGLGKGVEAATLASVTAAMAQEYVAWNIDTARAATILMDSLPMESRRRISYSTFTIVDAGADGRTRLFEHGNPPCLLVRDGQAVPLARRTITRPSWDHRILQVCEFESRVGDRILAWSDGVTQSGMGSPELPLGWGEARAEAFVLQQLARWPELASRRLCERIVAQAVANDGGEPGDDITCGIIAFRPPKRLLVLTGPPYDPARDGAFAQLMLEPGARKIICGGTTANIVARELRREAVMDLREADPEVPMASTMAGAELVTEGCLTLGKVAEFLEAGVPPGRRNAATRMVDLLLDMDLIDFQVGTRVNEAHQDPALPMELDIRRNVIRRIKGLLEEKHLKQVTVTYF